MLKCRPISLTDGGKPFSVTWSFMKSRMACCLSVNMRSLYRTNVRSVKQENSGGFDGPTLTSGDESRPRRRSDPCTPGAFVPYGCRWCSSDDLDYRYLDQRQLQSLDTDPVPDRSR